MKPVHVGILLIVLLAALAVAGCICCSNIPGGNGPTATPSGKLPTTPAGLNDMSYLWNNVRYLKESMTVESSKPGDSMPPMTMTWQMGNGVYEGKPARKLMVSVNSSPDASSTAGSLLINMAYDIYFSQAGSIMTLLGGHVYLSLSDDPEDVMEGDLNVSQLTEYYQSGGGIDEETGEEYTTAHARNFSPTMDLSRPVEFVSEEEFDRIASGGDFNLNNLMSARTVPYVGDRNATLSPAGHETLHVGSRNFDCYKYTWSVKLNEDHMDYTVWYSPEFPAMPLKNVYNFNDGERITTSVIDEFR